MTRGRRSRTGLVVPTLLAALAGGSGVLAVVLTAGAALTPHASLPPPVVAEVRPPEPLDAPVLQPTP
jgi:hypothetical protein